jgi:penicillin-binding protein 1B
MTKRRIKSSSKKRKPSIMGSRIWLWVGAAALVVMSVLALWTVYLDYKVREKFEGKKWSLPARVYAQPLELYVGMELSPALFDQTLTALGYRFVSGVPSVGQVLKRPTSSANEVRYQLHSRGFDFWDKREPSKPFVVRLRNNRVDLLTTPQGQSLPLMRLEPEEIGGFYPNDSEDRLLVRLQDLPPLLGETLIAVEDKNFLDHHGVSPLAILRAAFVNVRAGDVRQGGSTITQQLVKNFYLSNEQRFFQRKIPEAIMAVILDMRYSKAEILETYINEIFLGQSGAREIHGFALAAQHYFKQPLAELDVQELALLVGLVKGASFYNPWRNPERATGRRNVILSVMQREELITKAEYERAINAPLGVVKEGGSASTTYPAFMSLVKRQLRKEYAEEDLQSEGLRIFTTLAPWVQRQAEAAFTNRMEAFVKGYKVPELQGGMVVSSVGTGEILALIGDRNPRYDGFNRALDAKRQIGSLVKPFVYLAALDLPRTYNLGTPISDSPVSYKSGSTWWSPKNADRQDHGDVPLYRALAMSYNQATARLGMTVGLPRVMDTIRQAGFYGDIEEVPSMLLGSVEMTPIDVAGVYHTLAADGVYAPMHAIREVLAVDGKPLKRFPLEIEQRFSLQTSYLTQFAMQKVMLEGTGRTVYRQLPARLTVAGKTGTTNDNRDSWFAGFSGEHVAVVWIGRDDNNKTPFSGASGAMQVWGDFFAKLPSRGLETEPPPGVANEWIDNLGHLSAEGCPGAIRVPVRQDARPAQGTCQREVKEDRPWFWQRFR